MIDVSIIIINYYTSNLINNCIKSIIKHVYNISYEIIIVDNNTEDLSKVINLENKENIKLIQLNENVGFGRANNAAVKIAFGRNIFFLNPDTLLLNNAVKILSDYLDKNNFVGACGGNLYDEGMNPTLSFRRILPGIKWDINELLNLFPEKIAFGRNQRFNYSNHPINVGYITGADLMIPRKIFDEIGGFSPEFFMYYEETDLCLRINKLGKKIMCISEAKIIHLEGGSFNNETINYNRLERSEIGRDTYLRRNHSRLYNRITNYIYRLFLYSRVILKHSESHRFRLLHQKKMSQKQ